MPTEHFEDLSQLPWCQSLLTDPSITKYKLVNRNLPPPFDANVSNTFFGKTLFTDTAVRAYLPMYRKPISSTPSPSPSLPTPSSSAPSSRISDTSANTIDADTVFDVESYILVSIGSDCDGGIQRLHGGLLSTLLDQVMGLLVSIVHVNTPATAELVTRFKKVVRTPAVLLCRASIVEENGRRVRTKGSVEDGRGTVFAEGEGVFVKSRTSGGASI